MSNSRFPGRGQARENIAVLPFPPDMPDQHERLRRVDPRRRAMPAADRLERLIGPRMREGLHLAGEGLFVCAHGVQLHRQRRADVDEEVRAEHAARKRRRPFGGRCGLVAQHGGDARVGHRPGRYQRCLEDDPVILVRVLAEVSERQVWADAADAFFDRRDDVEQRQGIEPLVRQAAEHHV